MANNIIYIAFLLCAALATTAASAQTPMGDSLHYLCAKDTIFLELSGSQHDKYFYHYINKGQTVYSMARFYGLTPNDLYAYNPGLQNAALKIGQKVLIPLPNGAIRRYKDLGFEANQFAPIVYKIKKGDTLYGISKRVFRMEVEEMMRHNELDSFHVEVGQLLGVGWLSVHGIKDSIQARYQPTAKPVAAQTATEAHYLQELKKSGKGEAYEQGTAFWNKDDALLKKFTGLYAMHRSAPKGSYIRVLNPMNGRQLHLKVLGNFPYTSRYKKNVLVVLPPYVAQLLGARDESFFVKVWSVK
jgi:LysM repeat protein